MRLFALMLFIPLLASGAETEILGSVDCGSRVSDQRLTAAERTRAERIERNRQYGNPQPDLALAQELQLLAMNKYELSETDAGDAAAKQALDMLANVPPSAALATQLRAMGQRYHRQNNCKQAEPMYELAIAKAEKATDAEDAGVGAMGDLALLYRAQKRRAQLEPLYQRILAATKGQASSSVDMGYVHLQMSDITYRRKDYSAAQRHALASVALYATAAKPSASLAKAHHELAAAYYAQGRLADGDAARSRGKAVLASLAPPTISNTTSARPDPLSVAAIKRQFLRGDAVGAIANTLKMIADAEAVDVTRAEAVKRLQAAPSSTNPSVAEADMRNALRLARAQRYVTANLLSQAGELYHSQQQLATAEVFYRRVQAILEADATPVRAVKARNASDLGLLLRSTGAYAEAEQLQRQAFEMYLADFGSEHPDVIEAQSELASLAAAQGRHVEAEGRFSRLLADEERLPHPDVQRLSDYLRNLSALYAKLQRTADVKAVDARLAGLARAR